MALHTGSLMWAACTCAFVSSSSLETEATAMLHITHRNEVLEQLAEVIRPLPVIRGKYLFMSQGDAIVPEWLTKVASRNDSAAMWGYFDAVNQGEQLNISQIYIPGTTWTTGRNALYQAALDLQTQQQWRFEYLIFADEDAELVFDLQSHHLHYDVYSVFLAALSNSQPAIGSVGLGNVGDRNILESVVAPCSPDADGAIAAFHATAASIFLPYDPSFDESSWFNSQAVMIELVLATAADYAVQFNQFVLRHQQRIHHAYPRGLQDIQKPADGYSNIATYLRGRVCPCAHDAIGLLFDTGSVGVGVHECDISTACDSSLECATGTGAPVWRNFTTLIACKPFEC